MSDHWKNGGEVRAQLSHPVIDADGHILELGPALDRYLRQEGLPDGIRAGFNGPDGVGFGNGHESIETRKAWRANRSPWWGLPATPYEYATAALPRLFYERLDEFGIDLAIVYTTAGLASLHIDDDATRVGVCRAINHYNADTFAGLEDRMLPVGLVTAHTPEEAIESLEHAVNDLGFRTVLMPAFVRRPLPGARGAKWGDREMEYATWFDTYGIDSDFDYDPFWQRCVELKVALATHSIGLGIGFRQSISRFMYNDVGHFAATAEAVCKSLFMGGVTYRFPDLKFALLEGGVGWACSVYADMYSRWEKRNGEAVFQYDPRNFSREEFGALVERFGGPSIALAPVVDGVKNGPGISMARPVQGTVATDPREWENFDEWAPAHIDSEETFQERFTDHFWFGCEADDRSVKNAFDTSVNPMGARLNAIFSSDIGHYDVPDAAKVVCEAYEQREHEWLTEEEFRAFTFSNAVNLYGQDFFAGTVVERSAREEAEVPLTPAKH
jgi:predicted TIM-barrel fold metal-dependent hydrolase